MEVSYEERREIFYRDVERGDMVIGRVNSLRDFGLFVTLLCTAGGLERDIEDLEIKVRFYSLCSLTQVCYFTPSSGTKQNCKNTFIFLKELACTDLW